MSKKDKQSTESSSTDKNKREPKKPMTPKAGIKRGRY